MQAREWQLHLRLDAHGLGDAEARRLANAMPQERRLADPGLTANDEHLAPARRGRSRAAGPALRARRRGPADPADCGRPSRLGRLPTGSVNRWQTRGADQGLPQARHGPRSATLTPPTTSSRRQTMSSTQAGSVNATTSPKAEARRHEARGRRHPRVRRRSRQALLRRPRLAARRRHRRRRRLPDRPADAAGLGRARSSSARSSRRPRPARRRACT